MHYLDRLASLPAPPRNRSDRPADRPRRLRLDAEGSTIAVEIPGPRALASLLVIPYLAERYGQALRSRGELVAQSTEGEAPTPVEASEIAEALRSLVLAREGAGGLWSDLRLYLSEGSGRGVDGYLREAVASATGLLPAWSPPREARSGGRRSPTAQKASSRARLRAREIASARWWLELLLDDDASRRAGEKLTAADLYAAASSGLAACIDDEILLDDDDPDSIPRIPGPRVFYAVADEVLGPRQHGAGNVLQYRIPEPANPHRLRALLGGRRFARALTLQRERLAEAR